MARVLLRMEPLSAGLAWFDPLFTWVSMVASGLGAEEEPEGGVIVEGGVPVGVCAEAVKAVPATRAQAKRKFFMGIAILEGLSQPVGQLITIRKLPARVSKA